MNVAISFGYYGNGKALRTKPLSVSGNYEGKTKETLAPGETKEIGLPGVTHENAKVIVICPETFDDGTGKLTYKVGEEDTPRVLDSYQIFLGRGMIGSLPENLEKWIFTNNMGATVNISMAVLWG